MPAASLLLAEAIEEYLSWLELDRHSSPGTVKEFSRPDVGPTLLLAYEVILGHPDSWVN